MVGQVGPVLLDDGVCGFCHGAVRTILRLYPRGTLRFAALDSDFARGVIDRHPSLEDVDTVVFVDNPGQPEESVSVRTAAGLRVARYLGGPWQVLVVAGLIP